MSIDPVTLEVVKNSFYSIAEQMSVTMIRASYSTIMKEQLDVSSSIFDAQGRLVAEGANVPIHLNSLKPCLDTILEHYFPIESIVPGDVIITNDPYAGGGSKACHHTGDIIFYVPVFHEGKLLAISTIMAHHRDVGAMWSGTQGWNYQIWQEGTRIPPLKLYEGGRLNQGVMSLILNNTRVPNDMRGDLAAQLSGCNVGAKAILELVDRYDRETIEECIEELLDYSERRIRSQIERIPDGQYSHEEWILDDGAMGGPHRLSLTVTVSGSNMIFDYTGTDKQIDGPINSPWSATYSATHFGVRCITDPTIPSNGGCNRPVTLIAPEGTLVNSSIPAATFQRMVVDHIITDLILGALADVIPNSVTADSCGCCYNNGNAINLDTHPLGGEVDHRQQWGEVGAGGLGARPTKDGLSVMACCVTNTAQPSVEAQEIEAPVLFLKREFRMDSGGPGKYRGGLGQTLTWKVQGHEARFGHTSQKAKIPPQGLFGGMAGKPSKWIINEGTEDEQVLPSIGPVKFLDYGNTVTLLTAGGGGYGVPNERDPEAVRSDVVRGLVSVSSARDDYGVVLDSNTYEIDWAATTGMRAKCHDRDMAEVRQAHLPPS